MWVNIKANDYSIFKHQPYQNKKILKWVKFHKIAKCFNNLTANIFVGIWPFLRHALQDLVSTLDFNHLDLMMILKAEPIDWIIGNANFFSQKNSGYTHLLTLVWLLSEKNTKLINFLDEFMKLNWWNKYSNVTFLPVFWSKWLGKSDSSSILLGLWSISLVINEIKINWKKGAEDLKLFFTTFGNVFIIANLSF